MTRRELLKRLICIGTGAGALLALPKEVQAEPHVSFKAGKNGSVLAVTIAKYGSNAVAVRSDGYVTRVGSIVKPMTYWVFDPKGKWILPPCRASACTVSKGTLIMWSHV